MTMLASRNLVAFALIAIASTAFLFVGCSRGEEGREAPEAAAGETEVVSRMQDTEYVAKLEGSVDARKQLLATRASLMEQMEAEGADKESLQARIDDINKAIEDERQHAVRIVRQRIMADEAKESAAQ